MRHRIRVVASVVAVLALLSAGGVDMVVAQCEPFEAAKLLASDGDRLDHFGHAVGVSGNVAVVGAPAAGQAYVYRFTGSIWIEEGILSGSPTEDWHFGQSVAVDGDTIIVGEPFADSHTGRAFVFRYAGSTWAQEDILMPSDTLMDIEFGMSVSVSGNVAVMGAWLDEENASDGLCDSGAAYVFRRTGSVWAEEAKLLASDRECDTVFGFAVAVDGNVAVIGAHLHDDEQNGENSGAAYIFRYNDANAEWVEEAKLLASASSAKPDDFFGYSVDISGSSVVIGAVHGSGADYSSGSAYVFRRSGTSWTESALLAADNGSMSDEFGVSVGIFGDVAVVGAWEYEDGISDDHSGTAYIFGIQDTGWAQQAQLRASDADGGDYFGAAVAVDGDLGVVGAREDLVGDALTGSAYVFTGLADCAHTITDCNSNGVPDVQDIANGTSEDCNENGVPDECDIADGTSEDANGNDVPDECDPKDCNENGIPDEEDIASGTSQDCNDNDVPDECDITDGTSLDVNDNGIPDECDPDPGLVLRITRHPRNQEVVCGGVATFTVGATGIGLRYQWYVNGFPLKGATGPELTMPWISPGNDGDRVHCVVTNLYGISATSAVVSITVTEALASITPVDDELITCGQSYTKELNIANEWCAGDVTWSIVQGPAGAAVDDWGVVRWTPAIVRGRSVVLDVAATNMAGTTLSSWELTFDDQLIEDCCEGCPLDEDDDGVPYCYDNCLKAGNPDQADADGDGFGDACDGCPNDPDKLEPGVCGCGVEEYLHDGDNDGVVDCKDGCPNDGNKIDPGVCGCGTPDTDLDGDGVFDCLDNCPLTANPDQADADQDGIGDACEPLAPQPNGGPGPSPVPVWNGCATASASVLPLLLASWVCMKAGVRRRRRRDRS
ncbi:MAG: thrombospondin type 3 repeat-containing protein [Phycisphaerae bacterium]|nr:thrombospondin type 3 repeat-containing protein [Phycisphaerae bacterium]